MEVKELRNDRECAEAIKAFVASPAYLLIKDAFVSNTPTGESGIREDSIAVCHGKNIGTRYVFQEMEKICRDEPRRQQRAVTGGKDPDLQ